MAAAWLHAVADAATRARLERLVAAEPGARSQLGGEAVLDLGVRRGPEVATVLGALRDARLDGEIHERQDEIDYVNAWLHKQSAGRRGPASPPDSREG